MNTPTPYTRPSARPSLLALQPPTALRFRVLRFVSKHQSGGRVIDSSEFQYFVVIAEKYVLQLRYPFFGQLAKTI